MLGELLRLAHRKGVCASQAGQNRRGALLLGRGNENYVAGSQITPLFDSSHLEAMAAGGSSAKLPFKVSAEWVFSHHTHHQGRVGITERLGRPLHKLGKVVENCELDRVFSSVFALREGIRSPMGEQPAANEYGRNPSDNVPRTLARRYAVAL